MSHDSQELVADEWVMEIDDESPESPELARRLDDWVREIESRLQENPDISHAPRPSMDSDSSDSEAQPSIFGKWQCWDDFGADFIPETQRWHFVACMTHWFDLNVRLFLEYMQGKEDLAWSYYEEVDALFRTAENNKRFIEHLLVNSCFLIFAMVLLSGEIDLVEIIGIMQDKNGFPKGLTHKDFKNIAIFILQDHMRTNNYMLTMKNQIPWFVVEVVYTEFTNLNKLFYIPIHKLALLCFHSLRPREHPDKVDGGTIPKGGFQHLLHLFYWSRAPDGKYLPDTSTRKFVGNFDEPRSVGDFHIPSATQLQLSQIVFENHEGGSIDVSCSHKRIRVMQLTPWHLLGYSTELYKNLLIFERHYTNCGIPFTSYVTCMGSLLKTEQDVRVLRACGVIPTTRFDDKDVLRCIQELKNCIPHNLCMPKELIILEKMVMAHYKQSAYRVYGEFKSRYKDLITISAIGGGLLFVLTLIQTVVSIISLIKQ